MAKRELETEISVDIKPKTSRGAKAVVKQLDDIAKAARDAVVRINKFGETVTVERRPRPPSFKIPEKRESKPRSEKSMQTERQRRLAQRAEVESTARYSLPGEYAGYKKSVQTGRDLLAFYKLDALTDPLLDKKGSLYRGAPSPRVREERIDFHVSRYQSENRRLAIQHGKQVAELRRAHAGMVYSAIDDMKSGDPTRVARGQQLWNLVTSGTAESSTTLASAEGYLLNQQGQLQGITPAAGVRAMGAFSKATAAAGVGKLVSTRYADQYQRFMHRRAQRFRNVTPGGPPEGTVYNMYPPPSDIPSGLATYGSPSRGGRGGGSADESYEYDDDDGMDERTRKRRRRMMDELAFKKMMNAESLKHLEQKERLSMKFYKRRKKLRQEERAENKAIREKEREEARAKKEEEQKQAAFGVGLRSGLGLPAYLGQPGGFRQFAGEKSGQLLQGAMATMMSGKAGFLGMANNLFGFLAAPLINAFKEVDPAIDYRIAAGELFGAGQLQAGIFGKGGRASTGFNELDVGPRYANYHYRQMFGNYDLFAPPMFTGPDGIFRGPGHPGTHLGPEDDYAYYAVIREKERLEGRGAHFQARRLDIPADISTMSDAEFAKRLAEMRSRGRHMTRASAFGLSGTTYLQGARRFQRSAGMDPFGEDAYDTTIALQRVLGLSTDTTSSLTRSISRGALGGATGAAIRGGAGQRVDRVAMGAFSEAVRNGMSESEAVEQLDQIAQILQRAAETKTGFDILGLSRMGTALTGGGLSAQTALGISTAIGQKAQSIGFGAKSSSDLLFLKYFGGLDLKQPMTPAAYLNAITEATTGTRAGDPRNIQNAIMDLHRMGGGGLAGMHTAASGFNRMIGKEAITIPEIARLITKINSGQNLTAEDVSAISGRMGTAASFVGEFRTEAEQRRAQTENMNLEAGTKMLEAAQYFDRAAAVMTQVATKLDRLITGFAEFATGNKDRFNLNDMTYAPD